MKKPAAELVKPEVIAPPVVVTEKLAQTTPHAGTEEVKVSAPDTTIYFAFNKATLTDESKEKLLQFVSFVKNAKYRGVKVFAYTDSLGSKAYNKKLSRRRANAVKKFLEEQGIVGVIAEGSGILDLKKESCTSNKKEDLKVCYRHNRKANVVLF